VAVYALEEEASCFMAEVAAFKVSQAHPLAVECDRLASSCLGEVRALLVAPMVEVALAFLASRRLCPGLQAQPVRLPKV